MRVVCLRTDPFSDEQTNFVISDCRLGQNFSQLYDWSLQSEFILWPIRRRHLISFQYCVGKPRSFALDSQHRWMAARHHWLGAHNCYDRQYFFTFLSPVSRKGNRSTHRLYQLTAVLVWSTHRHQLASVRRVTFSASHRQCQNIDFVKHVSPESTEPLWTYLDVITISLHTIF